MKIRWKIAQAAEIRWWQGYLKKREKGAYLNWKKEYWSGFLKECELLIPQDATCLDAGCGPAGIFMVLNDQQVSAVDPLLNSYEEKLPHFNKEDYPDVRFICSSLESFESEKSFDYVFCLNAINHVSDLEKCWDKLFSFTKKGAKLIVSIDAHNHRFFKHIFRLLPGDILHPHQYNLQEYQQMIEKRGGRIIKTLQKGRGFFFDYYVLVVEV